MDYKGALMIFYVIMFAPYFEKFFSCDLQRLLTHNILAKHVVAFVSVFFVVALVTGDAGGEEVPSSSRRTLSEYAWSTAVIYVIYIATTKAKMTFVLPMLMLLVVDRVLDVYAKNDLSRPSAGHQRATVATVRRVLSFAIAALIAAGLLHYLIRARMEHGADFRWVTFFAGSYSCRGIAA